MSANILDDVRAYLILHGAVEGLTGWPCSNGYLPDDQPKAVGLFQTAGEPFDTLARENAHPGLVLYVRTAPTDYNSGFYKWHELFDLLQDAHAEGGSPDPLRGYVFIRSDATAPTVLTDANKRANFISNFRVMKARE